MKEITYDEACERVEDHMIVVVSDGKFEDFWSDIESIYTLDELENYKGEKDVLFGYDDVAEKEAEKIFDSLREEVKEYLYRFLLNENWLLW
ncbi:MAG: hypothetical protein LBI03_03780 [Clostridiales bacterium]|nr:hypothetical protein [Clostridiales bacterium]